MKAKWFYVLLNEEALGTLLLSPSVLLCSKLRTCTAYSHLSCLFSCLP